MWAEGGETRQKALPWSVQ